jgi:hypothetical protein
MFPKGINMNIDQPFYTKFPELIKKQKCLHQSIQQRDWLLITAGDSWTWGGGLCGIDFENGIYDVPDRVNKIYGTLLANKLDTDFINLGIPAGSNAQVFDGVKFLLELVKGTYKKITVVFTLTENCREAYGDRLWVPDAQDSLEKYLSAYEKNMFDSFVELKNQHDSIDFVIGRNFTYSFAENCDILGNMMVKKTWIDCLAEYQNKLNYPDDVRFTSQIALVPLHKLLKDVKLYNKYKFEFMSLYASSELAMTWLEESDLNSKSGTKHPTELGHEIWADYLYNVINQR